MDSLINGELNENNNIEERARKVVKPEDGAANVKELDDTIKRKQSIIV